MIFQLFEDGSFILGQAHGCIPFAPCSDLSPWLLLAIIVVLFLISLFRTGYPDNSNRSLRK